MTSGFRDLGGLYSSLAGTDWSRIAEDLREEAEESTVTGPDFAASPAISPHAGLRLMLAEHLPLGQGEAAHYLSQLEALIDAARLNVAYIPPQRILTNLKAMQALSNAGRLHAGHAGLTVHAHSGLPDRGAWLATEALAGQHWSSTAHAVARLDDVFEGQDGAVVNSRRPDVPGRLRAAEILLSLDVEPIPALQVELLNVDRQSGVRRFRVNYDSIVEPTLLQRISLELTQKGDGGRHAPLELNHHSEWVLTKEFRVTLERNANQAFELQLSPLEKKLGSALLSVSRGQVGPVWDVEGVSQPSWVNELMSAHPGNALAQFSVERVKRTSDQKWAHEREATYSCTPALAPALRRCLETSRDSDQIRVVEAAVPES